MYLEVILGLVVVLIPVILLFLLLMLVIRKLSLRDLNTRCSYIHNQTQAYIKSKRPEKGISFLEPFLKKYPEDYFLYNELGLLHLASKRYEEAIRDFREAIRLNENDNAPLVNLSWILNHLENYEEALSMAEAAIKGKSNSQTAHINKGDALLGLQRYQEAYDCFDHVIQLDRHYPYGYFGFGIACYKLGKYGEAVSSFEQYLAFVPKDIDALAYLAVCYFFQENYSGQVEMYDKIIRLNGTIPWIYCAKGNAQCYLGDFNGAIESFDKAIRQDPGNASAHYLKSRILSIFHQGEAAMEELKQAIRLDEKLKQEALNDDYLNNIKVFREFKDIVF